MSPTGYCTFTCKTTVMMYVCQEIYLWLYVLGSLSFQFLIFRYIESLKKAWDSSTCSVPRDHTFLRLSHWWDSLAIRLCIILNITIDGDLEGNMDILIFISQNVNTFGNRIFKEVIRLKGYIRVDLILILLITLLGKEIGTQSHT